MQEVNPVGSSADQFYPALKRYWGYDAFRPKQEKSYGLFPLARMFA